MLLKTVDTLLANRCVFNKEVVFYFDLNLKMISLKM